MKAESDRQPDNHQRSNGRSEHATHQDAGQSGEPSRLAEGDVLRADRISEAERELYLTDAYRQVIIRTEAAGETDWL